MIVKVTQRHINNGVQIIPDRCPVARAIRAVVKRSVDVQVGSWDVSLEYKGKIINRKLRQKARDFIQAFDIGEEVQPIEFSLNIPKQLLKQPK